MAVWALVSLSFGEPVLSPTCSRYLWPAWGGVGHVPYPVPRSLCALLAHLATI